MVNRFSNIEDILSRDVIFTIIVLLQALFGGRGLVHTPRRIESIFSNSFVRLLGLFMIAFAATKEIEAAVFGVALLVASMWVIKTPDERKEHGII